MSVNEDWKKNLATGLTAAALTLGGSNVAQAHTDYGHHRKHHHSLPSHQYNEQDIINSIVGEEARSFEGMKAVASAIRNRMKDPYYKHDILKGVYGRTASHVKHESPKTFQLAKRAWDDSATHDTVGGAYLWGYGPDVQKWKSQAMQDPKFWFNNVEPTITVGSNTFFRNK